MLDAEISIVNHDRGDLTRACLLTLPAACEGLRWHATVVDNASVDGSAEMVAREFPDVRLVCNRGRHGFGFNQNRVIDPVVAAGSARYVLVLNNDTELRPGSVAAMVRHADSNPRLAVVGPVTLNTDLTRQPSSFRFPSFLKAALWEVRLRSAPLGCRVADTGPVWLGGACLLLRTEALRAVGTFDTRFFLFFEDIDLAKRLTDAGWHAAVAEDSSIVHHNHQTVLSDELQAPMARQLRRSYYLYVEKYFGRVPAVGLGGLGRLSLLLRAAKALVTSGSDEASQLLDLGRYDPRRPLAHELGADAASVADG